MQSYTPQKIALEIAQQVTSNDVIDLFCGVGGNSIAFAKTDKMVTSVDYSQNKLWMAQANAKKFKVDANIEFIHSEVSDFLSDLEKASAIFLDPPWGGSIHRSMKKFGFNNFSLDIKSILLKCFSLSEHTIIKLPFNFDINELNQFEKFIGTKIIRHYLPNYTEKRPIMLTAHFKNH